MILISNIFIRLFIFDYGTDVDIPLGEGDLDISFPEQPVDGKTNIRRGGD